MPISAKLREVKAALVRHLAVAQPAAIQLLKRSFMALIIFYIILSITILHYIYFIRLSYIISDTKY